MSTWRPSGWCGRAVQFHSTDVSTDFNPYKLERYSHSKLRGERNAHRRSRAEEISERALGDLELRQAGNRYGIGHRAVTRVGSQANAANDGLAVLIRHRLRLRNRELHHVDGIVRAWVVAVEDIEELGEGINLPTLVNFDGA
jgi:hypothetical protein